MNPAPKQIIVMRKDLNMRRGKQIAQGCHASLGAVLSCGYNTYSPASSGPDPLHGKHIDLLNHPALKDWLENSFTKICVSVDSEQELLDIHQKAKDAGLINCLITDNGTTEFNGVPTLTCCAIGPAYPEELDPITGHLKLL